MSRLFLYDYAKEVIQKLPDHYKRRYLNRQFGCNVKNGEELIPFSKSPNNNKYYPADYFNLPFNVLFPPESQKCLWGNEGITRGYGQKNELSTIYPKTWAPKLTEQIFYSGILKRWMIIIVSYSVLKQIETLGNLDYYILTTPESELHSRLALHLKRDMLITLAKTDDKDILEKYAKFIIPIDEAEWIGLTLEEAVKKQMKLDYNNERKQIKPLKMKYLDELLSELSNSPTKSEEIKESVMDASKSISRILYGNKRQ